MKHGTEANILSTNQLSGTTQQKHFLLLNQAETNTTNEASVTMAGVKISLTSTCGYHSEYTLPSSHPRPGFNASCIRPSLAMPVARPPGGARWIYWYPREPCIVPHCVQSSTPAEHLL